MAFVLAMMVMVFVLAAVFDVSRFKAGRFLTEVDMPPPTQLVTITGVDVQEVGQGKEKEEKVCVTFAEFGKALGLNKTNATMVMELYSIDANNWIGKQLLLYRAKTTYGGKKVLCLRVCGPQQVPDEAVFDKLGNKVQPQSPVAPVAAAPPQQPVAAPQSPAAPVQQPAVVPQQQQQQPVAAPVAAPQPAAVPVQQPVVAPVQQQPADANQWPPQQDSPPTA